MTVDLTPLLALRLRTERLELRLPQEDDLRDLAELAIAGIHDPERMPFAIAWSDRTSEPAFVDEFVEYHLQHRRSWSPDAWWLELGVWERGSLAGVQAINADAFATSRRVTTGSWLGRAFQGRGIGTEMRRGVLALAFDGLGAEVAVSGALDGNDVSARVSEKLGYAHVGAKTVSPRGVDVRERVFELTRADHASIPHDAVELEGLGGCLALFGVTGAS